MIYVVKDGRRYQFTPEALAEAAFGTVGKLKERFIGRPNEVKRVFSSIIQKNIKRNLETGRAGRWPSLKRGTYVIRAIKGFPISSRFPALRRTGALERSFKGSNIEVTRPSKDTVILVAYSSAPHAEIQDKGGITQGEIVTLADRRQGNKRLKVLVNPGERVKVSKEYTVPPNARRKPVKIKVPARPFAFINKEAIEELRQRLLLRFWDKEI